MTTGAVRRIWVDTDIALGASSGDVDDGFALAAVALAAKFSSQVELLGVSAVSGNTDGATARRCAEAMLRVLGMTSVRVVAEADAPAEIAKLEDASILTIGPPTNVVAAAAIDPELPPRVSVRAVGTVLDRRRHPILPLFCLNFRTDPVASTRFFALPFRQRQIFPLDVVRRLRFGRRQLERIADTGEVGRYLADGSWRWLRQAPVRYFGAAFPVWDLVAGLHAIDRLDGTVWTPDQSKLTTFDTASAFGALLALLEG